MGPPAEQHRFNSDLLLTPGDREFAARKYPSVQYLLDYPALRELFSQYDDLANNAKRQGRRHGLRAILFVLVALLVASAELLDIHHDTPPPNFIDRIVSLPMLLAVASACFGIAGVAIGGLGLLYAQRKRDWLCHRLMTERIRQFHFQTFIFHAPDILKSLKGGEAEAKAFAAQRDLELSSFKMKPQLLNSLAYRR
jgi:hypothetical protein